MTFTEAEIERIEVLKDPKHAQPLGLLWMGGRQFDYRLLKKVGIENLDVFFANGWIPCRPDSLWDLNKTYILKEDFNIAEKEIEK